MAGSSWVERRRPLFYRASELLENLQQRKGEPEQQRRFEEISLRRREGLGWEKAAARTTVDPDGAGGGVGDPVLPHTEQLVALALDPLIDPPRPGGEDLDHQVRCAPQARLVEDPEALPGDED